MSNQEAPRVELGCWVKVNDPDLGEETIRLVPEEQASPRQGKISPNSPFAQALLGAKKGETVEFTGPTGQIEQVEILDVGKE